MRVTSLATFPVVLTLSFAMLMLFASPVGPSAAHQEVPIPSSLSTAASSNSVWWVGASSTDSSALPNTGVKGTISVVSFSTPNVLDFWVSDDLSNNMWGQVGYYLSGGQAPVAFYQIWNLNTNTVLTTGTDSVSTGAHSFAMYLQGGTTWAFSLDGSVFGTYNMGASISSSSYPVFALAEEQASSVFPFPSVSFSGIQALRSGSWSNVATAVSYGSAWGVEGQVQDSALASGDIVVGTSVPVLPGGTALWGSASTSSTTSTSFSNPTTTVTVTVTATSTATKTVTSTQTVTSTSTLTATSVSTSTATLTTTATVISTVTQTVTSTSTTTATSIETSTVTVTSPTTTTVTSTVTSTATSNQTLTTTVTATGSNSTETTTITVTGPPSTYTTTVTQPASTTTMTKTVTSTVTLSPTAGTSSTTQSGTTAASTSQTPASLVSTSSSSSSASTAPGNSSSHRHTTVGQSTNGSGNEAGGSGALALLNPMAPLALVAGTGIGIILFVRRLHSYT